MAVVESGYAAIYDGTTWRHPTGLSSFAGEPDSVSCPTVSFCMALDARDLSIALRRLASLCEALSWTNCLGVSPCVAPYRGKPSRALSTDA
jgi:hypothetical protein